MENGASLLHFLQCTCPAEACQPLLRDGSCEGSGHTFLHLAPDQRSQSLVKALPSWLGVMQEVLEGKAISAFINCFFHLGLGNFTNSFIRSSSTLNGKHFITHLSPEKWQVKKPSGLFARVGGSNFSLPPCPGLWPMQPISTSSTVNIRICLKKKHDKLQL